MAQTVDSSETVAVAPEAYNSDEDTDPDDLEPYLSSRSKARVCDSLDDAALNHSEMVDLMVESAVESMY